MPHYKDGTEAQVGDVARGKGYNYPYPVQGVVTRVVPGAGSCDITVSFAKARYPLTIESVKSEYFAADISNASSLAKLDDGTLLPVGLEMEHGTLLPVGLEMEHGTCAEFELVYRPTKQANGEYK